MKSLIAAGIALVFLIGGAIGYGIFVESTAGEIKAITDEATEFAEEGDYPSALEKSTQLEKMIMGKKTFLGAIADHRDIYDIQRELKALNIYLTESDRTDALASLASISAKIDSLVDNSLPVIFNIL